MLFMKETDTFGHIAVTSRTVLAYKTVVLPFFCLQELIYNVLVIFFCFETRGVRSPCKEFIDS